MTLGCLSCCPETPSSCFYGTGLTFPLAFRAQVFAVIIPAAGDYLLGGDSLGGVALLVNKRLYVLGAVLAGTLRERPVWQLRVDLELAVLIRYFLLRQVVQITPKAKSNASALESLGFCGSSSVFVGGVF